MQKYIRQKGNKYVKKFKPSWADILCIIELFIIILEANIILNLVIGG